MDSLLDGLCVKQNWLDFLAEKKAGGHLRPFEERKLKKYIEDEGYMRVIQNGLHLSAPQKCLVNKLETGKKRIVYRFADDEVWVLKLLCAFLYKYDNKLSEACYSFRKAHTAQKAIRRIMAVRGLGGKYCVKTDIHNYFNSIPAAELAAALDDIIDDDPRLKAFLKELLLTDAAYENGSLVYENRGAMAGCPLSPFFANIYLKELDDWFVGEGIPFYRYSDDMVFFVDTAQQAEYYKNRLTQIITKKGLECKTFLFFYCFLGEYKEL